MALFKVSEEQIDLTRLLFTVGHFGASLQPFPQFLFFLIVLRRTFELSFQRHFPQFSGGVNQNFGVQVYGSELKKLEQYRATGKKI